MTGSDAPDGPTPHPGTYWEAQERGGQLALSERDQLIVSTVRHGATWYLRLQVHRREIVDSRPTSVPGQHGLIVPMDTAPALVEMLTCAIVQPPCWPADAILTACVSSPAV